MTLALQDKRTLKYRQIPEPTSQTRATNLERSRRRTESGQEGLLPRLSQAGICILFVCTVKLPRKARRSKLSDDKPQSGRVMEGSVRCRPPDGVMAAMSLKQSTNLPETARAGFHGGTRAPRSGPEMSKIAGGHSWTAASQGRRDKRSRKALISCCS